MNTHDIELPPLPTPDADHYDSGTFAPVWKKGKMGAYALAAIEAYRKRKGEVVVTKTQDGEIIAVTRQDEEGRILNVIAEADSKRRGEPVGILKRVAMGEPVFYSYDDKAYELPLGEHPLYAAPQPAEPVKVPTKWSGWACQYPGKMPRLYGDKSIAMLNHHPEEGDRLLYMVEQSNPTPEPVKGPSDDELLDQALRERDAASEMADKLADAIAKHLGVEIGEHSSANHPWYRALDAIKIAQPAALGEVNHGTGGSI